MKRKGMKNILVLLMASIMLFGNVITASAEESAEETGEERNIFYESQEPDEEGRYHYVYSVLVSSNEETGSYTRYRGEITSKTPLAMYIGEEFERNGYTYLPYSIVNAPNMNMLLNSVYGGVEYGYTYENAFQTTKTDKGDVTTVEKFQYSWSVNTTSGFQGAVGTNIPIFRTKESAWYYLETLNDSESINKKKADVGMAEFDANLDFVNLRYKELSGQPRSHSISWDSNSSYDENTYVKINVDIKYKPILSELRYVYDWEWVPLSAEYLATNNNYTCLVNEPWQAYFAANSIDWSVFNTQWVDCFYLQVYKYHPDTDMWTHSNEWYVDCGSQTTGMSTVYETGIATKDPVTGEHIKDKVNIGDGTSGEYVGGVIEDVYDDIGDASDVGSYFTGVWKAFTTGFGALLESVGDIPNMVASVVSFLPTGVVTFIGLGVVVAIFLRIVGR